MLIVCVCGRGELSYVEVIGGGWGYYVIMDFGIGEWGCIVSVLVM